MCFGRRLNILMLSMEKSKVKNIIFLILIAVLLIPQTRKPIQVLVQKGVMLIKNPSIESKEKTVRLTEYNWHLVDGQNVPYNLQQAKGKVILINFWATWCPPCIAEMPSLQKLYNDYSDKVVFLFVTNEELSEINPFLEKKQYTFEVYRPISNYPAVFDVTSIPRTFLIDKEGHIIIDESGAANWNSDTVRNTIDNLLK